MTASSAVSTCNPEVFNFYTYLRTHPLLLRRHFASSDKARVGLTAEGRRADSISLEERRLFFTAAHSHLQAGCPMLALEVLSKMPKVSKNSHLQDHKETGLTPNLSIGSKNGQGSVSVWSHSALNGYESDGNSASISQSDSVLSFDWSQPSLTLPDESLELKWDSDKDEEDEEEEDAEDIKSPKSADSSNVFQDVVSPPQESVTDSEESGDFIAPCDDILAAQLKFTACLKIMTNELRTLSTGYELDGGKLRYQLYQWLEREVKTCKRKQLFTLKPMSFTSAKKTFSYLTPAALFDYFCSTSKQLRHFLLFNFVSPGGGSPTLLQLQTLFTRAQCPGGGNSECSCHSAHSESCCSEEMRIILAPFFCSKPNWNCKDFCSAFKTYLCL